MLWIFTFYTFWSAFRPNFKSQKFQMITTFCQVEIFRNSFFYLVGNHPECNKNGIFCYRDVFLRLIIFFWVNFWWFLMIFLKFRPNSKVWNFKWLQLVVKLRFFQTVNFSCIEIILNVIKMVYFVTEAFFYEL